MSLFVGNISKHVKLVELEEEFNRFGSCDIKRHGSYAFVEYNSEKGAEDAMQALNDVNLKGLNIGIEWSKRSTRYDPRETRRPPRRDSDAKCYNCNRIGHFARDCRSRRRSRSRSYERRGGGRRDSRSYSPRDHHRRREDREYRRRSPERRRRSPRRDSYERRDDRRYDERRGGRRFDSYERQEDWRDERREERRRSYSSGAQQRSQENRNRSPVGSVERRRSASRESGFKDKRSAAEEIENRPKSPVAGDRQQTDEREIENGAARADNPENGASSPRREESAAKPEDKE